MNLPVHIDLRPCAPNRIHHFQKWLRRPLSPLERSIIEPIERLRSDNRRHGRPTRIFVDDPGTFGPAIRDILILYLRWYSTLVTPRFSSCIIGRHRTDANRAVRRSFQNNDLKVNIELLRQARLTPERLASYKTAGWMRRLAPNISTASAKFMDHLRGRSFNNALILDADTLGHSTRRSYYGIRHYFRIRYQSYESVHSTLAAILPSAPDSLTIIHGNHLTHPRSLYARLRRQALAATSLIFHVLTPSAHPSALTLSRTASDPKPTPQPSHFAPLTAAPPQALVGSIGRDRPMIATLPNPLESQLKIS